MTPAPSGAPYLVFVTGPDRETMLEVGRQVVEERLAACVNVVPSVTSVYRWEGRVVEDEEVLALLKSTAERLERLEARVIELHPYEEPEFLAVRADTGSSSYVEWIRASVSEDVTA